jgi:hypothetical protein
MSQISENCSVHPLVRLKGVTRKSQKCESDEHKKQFALARPIIRVQDCEGRLTLHSVSSAGDQKTQEKNLSLDSNALSRNKNVPRIMTQEVTYD